MAPGGDGKEEGKDKGMDIDSETPPDVEAVALPGSLSLSVLYQVIASLHHAKGKPKRRKFLVTLTVCYVILIPALLARKLYWKKIKRCRTLINLLFGLLYATVVVMSGAASVLGYINTENDSDDDDDDD